MSDHSDSVAGDVLVREGAAHGVTSLRFRPRTRFVPVLAFGSWGVVIVVPMTLFFIEGELPGEAPGLALALGAVGIALVYAALRALVNGSRLVVDGGELRFARGPLWPLGEQRVALSQLVGARMALRPVSLRHPATYRGYPMPRPYMIQLQLRDQTSVTLPLTLGLRDAESAARWVEERL